MHSVLYTPWAIKQVPSSCRDGADRTQFIHSFIQCRHAPVVPLFIVIPSGIGLAAVLAASWTPL